MKKQYKLLLITFGIELLIISRDNNIKIQSWLGNAIGAFVLLFPIQILFFLLSKDENLSKRKKIIFKILF